MPLLEVVQTKHLSASIRLTDSTAMQVDQYAAFIHASANDVVEQALAYVFSKDREFQEFLRTPEAQRITPTLVFVAAITETMRRSGLHASRFPPASSNHRTSTGNRGGIEGMIPLQYQWQSHCGAAHRKKIDTPSLGWACFSGAGSQRRTIGQTTTYKSAVLT